MKNTNKYQNTNLLATFVVVGLMIGSVSGIITGSIEGYRKRQQNTQLEQVIIKLEEKNNEN